MGTLIFGVQLGARGCGRWVGVSAGDGCQVSGCALWAVEAIDRVDDLIGSVRILDMRIGGRET